MIHAKSHKVMVNNAKNLAAQASLHLIGNKSRKFARWWRYSNWIIRSSRPFILPFLCYFHYDQLDLNHKSHRRPRSIALQQTNRRNTSCQHGDIPHKSVLQNDLSVRSSRWCSIEYSLEIIRTNVAFCRWTNTANWFRLVVPSIHLKSINKQFHLSSSVYYTVAAELI